MANQSKPNIVAIMTDDVGYFELSAYHRGLGVHRTPNIDRLAKEGLLIADYYAQPSCTARRSAFITGQYPIRTGLTSVGQPGMPQGLQKEDPTIAALLKPLGYATAQFGKSHVGDRNEYLPTVHGFDEFFGYLYHLNMMEQPEQSEFSDDPNYAGQPRNVIYSRSSDRDDPTIDPRWGRVGKQVIEDRGPLPSRRMETIDEEIWAAATEWLDRVLKAQLPFFLWFNPSRMHQKTHVPPEFRGKSGHGAYADGMMQLDAMVGRLLAKLDQSGVADNTIVLFTSDNGTNLAHWPDSGTQAFRGEKGTTWDGGFRVPMLIRWPGRIPANEYIGELMTSEDWLPTLLAAAGVPDIKEKLLTGYKVGELTYKAHLDGYNQLDTLTKCAKSKRREFFFYAETQLNAVRVDHWKVHTALKSEWLKESEPVPGGLIIDIKLDPFERSADAPGHFLWMKEKTWILPQLLPPIRAFMQSLKDYPPRQKGAGIGAEVLSQIIESDKH